MSNLNVTDELNFNSLRTSAKEKLLDWFYPIGSYYITESSLLNSESAINNWFGGTWEQLEDGRFLESGTSIGNKEPGLPNITGSFRVRDDNDDIPLRISNQSGCFYSSDSSQRFLSGYGSTTQWGTSSVLFNANSGATVSGIYGNSTTVQPKSRTVYIYKRIG